MNINLEYYRIFYHVAHAGSFTAAARNLHISQPAVSQAIQTLESGLDTQLFKRTAHGVTLTEAGSVLFHYVETGVEAIENGERKVEGLKTLEYGELQIGASDMTLQYFLLPYLEKYHNLYPNIKVHITNAPTPLTLNHLFSGSIDFGVVSTPLEANSRLKVQEAREIEDIFIAGDKYRELEGKTLSYQDLKNYPLICLEHNTSTRKYVDSYLATKDVILTPEFELATSNMIVQFTTQNLGIGCVVADFAKRFMDADRVFQLKFKEHIPKRKICVITDNRHEISHAAEKLMELINE